MSHAKYSAILLRYVHDVVSAEFVNVGLLFICPEKNFIKMNVIPRARRVIEFFPGARAKIIRQSLRTSMRSFKDIRGLKSIPTSSREGREKLISELAYSIVHKDDSALQWSPPFHGLTNNEEETFDRLFERLILRYENGVAKHKRSDEQVWRTFSKELEARNLSSNIEELEIETKVETIKFNHAIKNGKWHLLEPVSFDLSSADSITDKAKRLLGQMTLLKGHKSDFRLYFLVGQPSESQNCDAYLKAIKILEEIPFDKSIYPESRADEFAKELSNLTAAH